MRKQISLIVLLGCLLTACAPPTEPVAVTRPVILTATAVPTLTNTPAALPTYTVVSPTIMAAETAMRRLEPGIEVTDTLAPIIVLHAVLTSA